MLTVKWVNSSILSIDEPVTNTTNPNQSGHRNNRNEGIFPIPQRSSNGGLIISMISIKRRALSEGAYDLAEMQSVYSIVPIDWASIILFQISVLIIIIFIGFTQLFGLKYSYEVPIILKTITFCLCL